MSEALLAAGLVIALGDLALLVICWRHRTALGGVLAAVGLPLVAFALVSGATRTAGRYALLIAAGALVIGTALYCLGQVFERLLDEDRD